MSKRALNERGERVRLRRAERSQVTFGFQCLDELIPQDHPARTIWQIIERLDLSKFYAPLQAVALLPQMQEKRQEQASTHRSKAKQPEQRVSTTQAQTVVMKMADGGFRPAVNVQVATETASRAIVRVAVHDQGTTKPHAVAVKNFTVSERSEGSGVTDDRRSLHR